jgi:hypothetical protein
MRELEGSWRFGIKYPGYFSRLKKKKKKEKKEHIIIG